MCFDPDVKLTLDDSCGMRRFNFDVKPVNVMRIYASSLDYETFEAQIKDNLEMTGRTFRFMKERVGTEPEGTIHLFPSGDIIANSASKAVRWDALNNYEVHYREPWCHVDSPSAWEIVEILQKNPNWVLGTFRHNDEQHIGFFERMEESL